MRPVANSTIFGNDIIYEDYNATTEANSYVNPMSAYKPVDFRKEGYKIISAFSYNNDSTDVVFVNCSDEYATSVLSNYAKTLHIRVVYQKIR